MHLRPEFVISLFALLAVVALVAGSAILLGFASPDPQRGADPGGEMTAELRAQLESLGYVGATRVPEDEQARVGVVRRDGSRSAVRLAVYTPCGWGPQYQKAGFGAPRREARLIDHTGEVLHVWKNAETGPGSRGWANAKVGPDGSLYVVHARTSLARLDWNSRIQWSLRGGYHHDLQIMDDGTVVVLIEERRTIEHRGRRVNLLDNGLAYVSPAGVLQRKIWFYDGLAENPLFRRSLDRYFELLHSYRRSGRQPRSRMEKRKLTRMIAAVEDVEQLGFRGALGGIDLFHANTVEVLPADPAGRWNAGDILTSFRNLHTIAVVDQYTGELRWSWGAGELHSQHDPSLLPNGNILVFDNRMEANGSRVIELETARREIVWTYEGSEDEPFFSNMRGQARRLDNANVLIVSSQSARAFEVTRSGEIVWEFFGHDLFGGHRVPIRMTHLDGAAARAVAGRLRPRRP